LLFGTFFTSQSTVSYADQGPPVIGITDTMARRFWPSEDPIGRQIQPQGTKKPFTVVGVVNDIGAQTLEDERAPYSQTWSPSGVRLVDVLAGLRYVRSPDWPSLARRVARESR
jgi:hypothetical protein